MFGTIIPRLHPNVQEASPALSSSLATSSCTSVDSGLPEEGPCRRARRQEQEQESKEVTFRTARRQSTAGQEGPKTQVLFRTWRDVLSLAGGVPRQFRRNHGGRAAEGGVEGSEQCHKWGAA